MNRILFFLLSLSAVPMASTAMEQKDHKKQEDGPRNNVPVLPHDAAAPRFSNDDASQIVRATLNGGIEIVTLSQQPPRLPHSQLLSVLSRVLQEENLSGVDPDNE